MPQYPSASQGLRPIAPPQNPLELAGQVLGIKQARQSIEANRQTLETGKLRNAGLTQDAADEAAIRKAAELHKGDLDLIQDELDRTNPNAATKFSTAVANRRKTEADTLKTRLDNAARLMETTGQIAQSIRAAGEKGFQQGKARLTSLLGPAAGAELGDAWDESRIDQLINAATTRKDYLAQQQQAIENARNAAELTLRQGKDSREAQQAWTKSVAHALSLVDTPEQFAAAARIQKTLGAPANVLEQFPDAKTAKAYMQPQSTQDKTVTPYEDWRRQNPDAPVSQWLDLTEKPQGQGPQSPVAVIGEDGKPVFVRPTDAYGRRPANTREQGRPVISGDANRIAEYNDSIGDVAVLTTVVGDGITGARAKLGASLPNWATELTGWGEDAKSRQAVIDRVKQVIGKALEGGVLRKEDEIKYEKILPTIGDVKSVVTSKLRGLEEAIGRKKVNLMDALEDAGYEVARFRARGGAPDNSAAPPAGSNPNNPLNLPGL
jgi:hypothetical protein